MVSKAEKKKFLWETAGDARDFIKKQLLQLEARQFLSLGFYFVLAYTLWRSLGRVAKYDPQVGIPDDVSPSEWFWGAQREVLHSFFKIIHAIGAIEIPGIGTQTVQMPRIGAVPLPIPTPSSGIHPFKFIMYQGDLWWKLCIRAEYVDGQWYYKAVPLEFRILMVLSVVSLLFIMQKFGEILIAELGELVPL